MRMGKKLMEMERMRDNFRDDSKKCKSRLTKKMKKN